MWLDKWPFVIGTGFKGWITLGVEALFVAWTWWFLYKNWLYIYFRRPRRNQKINPTIAARLATPKRAENKSSVFTPSGDSLASSKRKEFKTWVVMMAHPMMNRSFIHHGCCFILSLLSKARKSKSTTIESVCHWLYALDNLARRIEERFMRLARDILLTALLAAGATLAGYAYQLFTTDLHDIQWWRFVVVAATCIVTLFVMYALVKLIIFLDEKEEHKKDEELIEKTTQAINAAIQEQTRKGRKQGNE